MSSVVLRNVLSLVFAAGLAGAASAQSVFSSEIPDKEINRDSIRRALLDTCVYGESAKEGAKKDRVADACQCASFKVMKRVGDEEVAKIVSDRAIPDEMYAATTEAFATCTR